ncbi:MAG: 50S ribosomal protein L4 [Candidatus Sericytochromatia bacterium]|nr:50S ribosomal protein L4 [Candidatus Sericytochromatia bacterium]
MTVTVKKYDVKENNYNDLELNEAVFGQTPNVHVMHLAVVRQMANARTGTACTLTRSEVRGGGKKPWKQKGTGRARAGSIRSPLWKGGGVIFGPKPRSFEKEMPKKVRKLALRSALSSEVEKILILSHDMVSSHKTSDFVKLLKNLDLDKVKKVLIVIGDNNNVRLSARNLPNVKVVYPENLGVYDLVNSNKVLISEESIAVLEGRAINA